MNVINLGLHFNKTKLDNPSAWGFSVLTLSTFANLLGFVLFNILGGRNQAFLLEKHEVKVKSLSQAIQDLKKVAKKDQLPAEGTSAVATAFASGLSPVVLPAASVSALSSPES